MNYDGTHSIPDSLLHLLATFVKTCFEVPSEKLSNLDRMTDIIELECPM